MCYAIYLTLIGLFLIYSDSMLSEHALSASSGGDEWMIVALGWEIIPAIWPAFVMALIISSAVTFIITRRIYSAKNHSQSETG